jgi:periplasmic protein TonB
MPMLEQNREPEVESSPYDAGSEQKQRRQMLIALALLLVALIAVFLKDREFWQQFLFPSTSTAATEPEPTDQTALDDSSQARPRTPGGQSVAVPSKAKAHPVPAAAIPEPTMAPVVTNRAVLPPLEVEVVAGDEHRTIQPGNPSVKVDLRPRTPPTYSGAAASGASGGDGGAVNATAQVHLSPGAAQVVSRPVDPTYPLLAKQMKVQGSVVLQALIGKDGNIQDLHVLSGPAILSAAAREAVKQWRFKPYIQAGQAVETEARITVNFTISTQ